MAADFERIDLCIRTLSSTLYNMSQGVPPVGNGDDTPALLRHVATLLTRGTSDKIRQDRQMVAVSAVTQSSGLTFIAAQDSSNSQTSNSGAILETAEVRRNPKTFKDIVQGNVQQTLEQYIADLLGLFFSIDPDSDEETTTLSLFVLMRCVDELHSRLRMGQIGWKSRLSVMLQTWAPIKGDKMESFWVNRPPWALAFGDAEREIKKRRTEDGREEWQVSIETSRLWTVMLGQLLSQIDQKMQEYNRLLDAEGENALKDTNYETYQLLTSIEHQFHMLYRFVIGYRKVVKALLGIESLSALLQPTNSVAELALVNGEKSQDRVYRYLEGLVAWQAAVHQLLRSKHREIFKGSTSAIVVRVSGFRADVMLADDIYSGLLERYPVEELFTESAKTFLESNVPLFFDGSVHPEAILMGLLSHSRRSHSQRNNHLADNRLLPLEEIFELTPHPPIAFGKKYCWCCRMLAETVILYPPASHEFIYPWSSPRIGIELEFLKNLERNLWEKLYRVLLQKFERVLPSSWPLSFDDSDDSDDSV